MLNRETVVTEKKAAAARLKSRLAQILAEKIEFIPSTEFEQMLSQRTALTKFEAVITSRSRSTKDNGARHNLTCLATALNESLLSFAEEQHEFRRMNYLKFVAAKLRSKLNPRRPSIRTLDAIERLLGEAAEVRNHIVKSNLRLVISNAGKYSSTGYLFEDLVSDGSLAIVEAVDKFDYQRGFRFSTYATHAIRRSFFRKIERRQKERQRFVVTDPDVLATTPDSCEVDFDAPAENRLIHQVIVNLGQHLTERELHIVEGRFGLNGRSEPRTLMELSGELGICKERVRQVEGMAIQKLREAADHYSSATFQCSSSNLIEKELVTA